ncbi:monovalent cation/H(+) antiporter subunit G [Jeotgalicoccus halotolerans]|uniref:Multisubunit sodium/proton antiporter MrpG subunit n=1 Tax=Jeotgalicoccus halotolerans TaxID=157227 RepID=A0A3E0ARI6_9STAP|nr:monovalent cation/H(+) antiporter subunit G [Jeotgalicoccus halotolerans]REG20819.1 multisubunit sodium/proton antiporter MrpG subunit [Jeotgalicoccus halotolerans]
MTEIIIVSLIALFLLAGAFFTLVAAIGVIRLPDTYTRLHAASKSSTLGVGMTLIGVFIYFAYYQAAFDTQLLLAVLFIFISAPVGAHLIARSAFHSDVEPYQLTILNELKRDETGSEVETEETTRLKIERSKNKELDD